MADDKFTQKMTDVLQQADDLRAQIETDAGAQPQVANEAIDTLLEALEELHVAQEELIQSNDELENTRLQLETEKYRYQDLFEFAPDGYFVTDLQGVIREANAVAATVLGYQPEHLIGKPVSVFVHETQLSDFRKQINQFSDCDRITEWELTLIPREQPPFPASLTVAIMCNPQGVRTGLRWMLRDITERRKIELALQKSHIELEERVEERTGELRTLVNAMAGREVRMAELKKAIRKLRGQVETAGMTPVANDPLLEPFSPESN